MKINNIEQQLRCPSGPQASEIGDIMYDSNRDMIHDTISMLADIEIENLLEIGHGNGKHVSSILELNKKLRYQGIEISAEMYNEAIENNAIHIENDRAFFRLYEGEKLPYPNHSFDTILTINTIYYWSSSAHFLNEIKRVLTTSGNLIVTFIHKETTQNQTFLGPDFIHYSHDEFLDAIISARLNLVKYTVKKVQVTNKIGEEIERSYGIYQLNNIQ